MVLLLWLKIHYRGESAHQARLAVSEYVVCCCVSLAGFFRKRQTYMMWHSAELNQAPLEHNGHAQIRCDGKGCATGESQLIKRVLL
jgi:uncharacterized membrane protein